MSEGLDPGRVLAAVARAAGVRPTVLVAAAQQARSPAPLHRWQEDPLTVARIAAVVLLREQGLRHRAIGRVMRRSPAWVHAARELARLSGLCAGDGCIVRVLVVRARHDLAPKRPSADDIAALLRKHRDDAQAG